MTYGQARDEMFAMLKARWDLFAPATVDNAYTPDVFWQGKVYSTPPPVGKAFARATVLHAAGRQASLAGEGGARRFSRRGMVMVQCFGPNAGSEGLTIAEALGKIVTDTYEGQASPGGIWFRNCRINEVGPDDGWFQVNAYADFIYDEVK